jgi:hypothetical protein
MKPVPNCELPIGLVWSTPETPIAPVTVRVEEPRDQAMVPVRPLALLPSAAYQTRVYVEPFAWFVPHRLRLTAEPPEGVHVTPVKRDVEERTSSKTKTAILVPVGMTSDGTVPEEEFEATACGVPNVPLNATSRRR